MRYFGLLIGFMGVLLASCAGAGTPAAPATIVASPIPASRTPPPTATVVPESTETPLPVSAAYEGLPLPRVQGALFSGSGACNICHSNMSDSSGADVSFDAFWRSTMMANGARDPYWRASVQAEVQRNPDLQDVIEAKCAQCHMPMAAVASVSVGEQVFLQDDGFWNQDHPQHELAIDGVSCTVCHQILPGNLGEPESFSGGFWIDLDTPQGERRTFGPFASPPGQAAVMASSSGFLPVQSSHIKEAALCATCHTLYTPTIGPDGDVLGEFPEQVIFLEWAASEYAGWQTCQSCHMPQAEGGVQLSVTGGPVRSPVYQHAFVGGNVNMLSILQRFGQEMGVTASSDQFQATIDRTLDQLQTRTASIEMTDLTLSGSSINAVVTVRNLAGHKFPAGFPSRRAWLRFVVSDAAGEVIFESGAIASDGSIVGNANDENAAQYEQHAQIITSPEQVQIYEAILRDAAGSVSTELMRAASYLKDNRLLPAGFEKEDAEPDVAVRGGAWEDEDFLGGGDQLQYAVEVGDAQGPFTVRVELLYQSISFRWVDNLRAIDGDSIETFMGLYDRSLSAAILVSAQELEVGP